VRQALKELKDQGYLLQHQGQGTFVTKFARTVFKLLVERIARPEMPP
jgi:DNA-binding GntR family transcriptional regulator